MNTREAHRRAERQREAHPPSQMDRRRERIGGERIDEIGGLHCVALRQAAARDFSARCSATRTATSLIESRAAVAAIDWPSSEIAVTISRWRGASFMHDALDVAAHVRVLRFRRGEHRLEILDRFGAPRAAPPHRVDDLVARDRVDPGRQPGAAVPGVPLQMDRQQSFLHDILDIRVADPHARKRPSRHRANRPADLLEQPTIGRLVARQGGAHHRRPFVVAGTDGRFLAHSSFAPSRQMLQPEPDPIVDRLANWSADAL